MVDYRDEDNISTAFIWNPANGRPVPGRTFTAADLSNRVVFGVEKSRLVIHEAYAEHVNDRASGGGANPARSASGWN